MQVCAIATVALGKFPTPDGREFDEPPQGVSLLMAEISRTLAANHSHAQKAGHEARLGTYEPDDGCSL
jgi:hypothetical protein